MDKQTPKGRWSQGPSLDGRGEFSVKQQPEPEGEAPTLGKARPPSVAQKEHL